MVSIVVQGVEEPMHCLMIQDSEYTKCTLLLLGEREMLRKKMREVSEVLHVAGDHVVDDMSNTRTGYPTINHGRVHLQVIPWSDYMEGHEGLAACKFEATGAHLT